MLETKNINIENWTFKGGMKTDSRKDNVIPIHSKIQSLVKKDTIKQSLMMHHFYSHILIKEKYEFDIWILPQGIHKN